MTRDLHNTKKNGQKAKKAESQSDMDIIMCVEEMKKMMKTKAHFHKVMATVKKEIRFVLMAFLFFLHVYSS